MSEFRMPSLGTDMEAGTLTAWLVKVGDRVQRGQVIAEVNTDKGAIEIEVFHDGVVEELLIQPGQKVPVETVLARIREPGEPAPVATPLAVAGVLVRVPVASEPGPAVRPVEPGALASEPAPVFRPVEPGALASEPLPVARPLEPGVAALASEPGAVPARSVGVPVKPVAGVPVSIRSSQGEVGPVGSGPGRVHASPLARRVAADLGVELSRVQGTGTGGAITREDVERAAGGTSAKMPMAAQAPAAAAPSASRPPSAAQTPAAAAPSAAPARAPAVQAPEAQASAARAPVVQAPEAQAPASAAPPATTAPSPSEPGTTRAADFAANMRRAIAAAMARSKREIPHYYLETPIDMSRATAWLQAENSRRPITERLLPVVLLLKAVARALGDVPELNGFWVDDRLEVRQNVHVGFAVALRQGGLVSPAIHDVDLKGIDELMAAIHDLIPRVRAGRLKSSELSDATITMTNLGDLGVQVVHGIIYPPQVALVGFGRVSERPWAENGMLGIRPVLTATLAGDHRATDGRTGARYLEALNRYLQEPEKL